MGTIKEYNDSIWRGIFRFFYPITDNVYLVILFVSILFALITFLISYIVKKKWNIHFMSFGLLSMLMIYSIGYMTQRLPMVHPRMQRSLAITSNIIAASNEYKSSFEETSGIQIETELDIATYLYYLPEKERLLWNAQPEQLYDSLFSTFDQIRGGFFLNDVNITCYGEKNFSFILVPTVLLMIGFNILFERREKFISCIIIFFLQCGFILYITTYSSGAALGAICMWLTEDTLRKYEHTNFQIRQSQKHKS